MTGRWREGIQEGLGISEYAASRNLKHPVEALRREKAALYLDRVARELSPMSGAFLWAARELKIAAQACLVIEDAEKGVIAAHRAGMMCVAVPNELTRGHDFRLADKVLDSHPSLLGI